MPNILVPKESKSTVNLCIKYLKYLNKQSGFVSLPLVISFMLLAGLTIYSILQQTNFDHTKIAQQSIIQQLPSPTPTPALSPIPSHSQLNSPTPAPSLATDPSTKPVNLPQQNTPPSSGYSYISVNTEKGSFPAHVVTLQNPTMVTDTANDSDCSNDCPTLPLAEFVTRNGGFAGIHGTYFCTADYAECASKKNSFDFSVYNSRLNKWINQGQLSWNGRSLVYKDGGGYHYMQNANGFGGGLNAGVVNYPGILNNGQISLEDGSLSDKQRNAGTKGGIGLNGNTVYLVIAPNVTMYEFALIFKAIGAKDALNLDGGGSAALYFNGYKFGPGRSLPNAIVFK